MGRTNIEWAHYTFNPWVGCTKVAPPCDNCYAEGWAKRSGMVQWGHHSRVRTETYWKQPFKWARQANGSRPRVFCCSLADWLDNKAERQWREDLADLIRATPELDWLLLTKRIQNYERAPWPHTPDNVWLGITCGDQKEYERDWPILSRIKAQVRFISYEPALGPLTRLQLMPCEPIPDWIICGGESGPKARMMNPQWARDLRDQCAAWVNVAFFMKQMTGKKPIPPDLLVRQFPMGRA